MIHGETVAPTTSDVRPLFAAEGGEPVAHFCGKCRRVIEWPRDPKPERCRSCDTSPCDTCGRVIAPRSYCLPCSRARWDARTAKALAEAEVVEGYEGPVFHDNEFFRDMEELYDLEEIPDRVFCATRHTPSIDVSGVLENVEENASVGDYEFDWTDVESLDAFVAEWCAGQSIIWWEEDRSRCVELRSR